MAWNYAGTCSNCGGDLESDGPTNIRHRDTKDRKCSK